MNNYITIAEYAKIKGVSVQAVYKRLNTSLKPFVKQVENRKMLDIACLEEKVHSTVEQPYSTDNSTVEIDLLRRLLTDKDKEIERLMQANNSLMKQNSNLIKLVDQQQQLQAQQTQLLLKADAVEQEQEQESKEPIPDEPSRKEPPQGFKRLLNSIFKSKDKQQERHIE